ncbi:mitochondrial inner membrane protease subunit 1 [Bacillus rossius redtenbacheri]|uniref:mitochondrial inner membrane protease subunit 1 n=1 Tax=Bacillus rossius redtenbacheri TaxID=93214 RepID=UPI002FDD770C
MNSKLVKFAAKCVGVVGYVIQYACVAHCTLEYVGDFVVCSGPSMEPTIVSDDVLFTEHISPRLQLIKKGDIVISTSPSNPRINICKRVAGTAGDKVSSGLSHQVVPRGHVWLEGDNYGNSSDSRQFGPVPEGLIRGRAVCKVWPPRRVQMLTW